MSASSDHPADAVPAAPWRVSLLACVLIAAVLHAVVLGALMIFWPGYGGQGLRTSHLRATIRSMPPAPLPTPPSVAGKQSPQAPAQMPPPQVPHPPAEHPSEVPTQVAQSAADGATDDSGGGQMGDYIPVELLEQKPHFLVDMEQYIPASLPPSEVGRLVMQLLIGADGAIDGIVIETSELTPSGTRRFVQRMDALKLAPGMLDGKPVKCRWRLEFTFAPVKSN